MADYDCKACQQGRRPKAPQHTRIEGERKHPIVTPAPDWRVRGTLDRAARTTQHNDPSAAAPPVPTRKDPDQVQEGQFDTPARPPHEPASSSKGPDTVQEDSDIEGPDGTDLSNPRRKRTAKADSSTQATPTEEGPEWSSYDTKKALRILPSESCPEARKRILRKLHCRFWHATASEIMPLLTAGGATTEI